MYDEGISIAGDALDAGVEYGVIEKSGNTYSFDGEKLGVGRENAKATMRGNARMLKEIKKQVWEKVKSGAKEKKVEEKQEEQPE